MYYLKGIKLYFLSIFILLYLKIKEFYFKSIFYNKSLISYIPDRIFYSPSSHLIEPLTVVNNKFYETINLNADLFSKKEFEDNYEFNNLHNFLWLTKLDRKKSREFSQSAILHWIKMFDNYNSSAWSMNIIGKRIIAWLSNSDITIEESKKEYKEIFILSIIKQSNHIKKNISNLPYDSNKIICCAAIILSGLVFKGTIANFKFGIKELEKIIFNYFDKNGFPKSRNPEEVVICLKYLILIREWIKEAQEQIPHFLNENIYKCGNCFNFLSSSNKKIPLFNGANEYNYLGFDQFLNNLKYKFDEKKKEIGGFFKIKNKKIEFLIDVGNPPSSKFSNHYQAGCLSFELVSNGEKIISNIGYGRYFSPKLSLLSRATAAHSTLHINNSSSCTFQKNRIIRKIYGNSLIKGHKILQKDLSEDNKSYNINASHNGYEKNYGYIHKRSVKIYKKENKIIGIDELQKKKNYSKPVNYNIRFHMYPGVKIVKTKGGRTILISLQNGEGWHLSSLGNDLEIEESIFLGKKKNIIKSECIKISGKNITDSISIEWLFKKLS